MGRAPVDATGSRDDIGLSLGPRPYSVSASPLAVRAAEWSPVTASTDVSTDALPARLAAARRDYAALVEQGLSLDLTRGKPSALQLDLAPRPLRPPAERCAA